MRPDEGRAVLTGDEEQERKPLRAFFADARDWDDGYDQRSARGHWWNTRLHVGLDLIGEGPGSLLEVGTGPGRLLEALARRRWNVTAVDFMPEMVQLARERMPAARVAVSRAEALPFRDREFDALVAIGVLQYTELDRALCELARVLRPGALAVVGFQHGRAPTALWRRKVVLPVVSAVKRVFPFGRAFPPPRRPPPSLAEARALLANAGFVVERLEYASCGVLLDPFDALMPRVAYRAGRWAERSRTLRRVLGTQRMFLLRKSEDR